MTDTAAKAGGRLVSAELRDFINRRVDRLAPIPARLGLREELYQIAVDLRGAGFAEQVVEKRLGDLCSAFAAIESAVRA